VEKSVALSAVRIADDEAAEAGLGSENLFRRSTRQQERSGCHPHRIVGQAAVVRAIEVVEGNHKVAHAEIGPAILCCVEDADPGKAPVTFAGAGIDHEVRVVDDLEVEVRPEQPGEEVPMPIELLPKIPEIYAHPWSGHDIASM
jgi:hypothetical protein